MRSWCHTRIINHDVGLLPRLRSLRVPDNRLTQLPAELWERPQPLTEADVGGNPFVACSDEASSLAACAIKVPTLFEVRPD
jgi:hypothetical protein